MNGTTSILLVEDDVVDVMSVRRALRELNITNPLNVVGNGEEALVRLQDKTIPSPGIILLDINMPRMNGIDFLRALKNDLALRRIPVVILTTSKEENDRLRVFDLSAAGYMLKPVEYNAFVNVMRTIQGYWKTSEMPP